jgi:TolA-binding protein
LKAQYGKLVLRDEIRDDILRTVEERFEAVERTPRPSRTWRYRTRGRVLFGAGVAFALGLVALIIFRGHEPVALEAIVSTVAGEAFAGDTSSSPLSPKAHVAERQRLHTAASGSVETRVGKHVLSVGSDSDLRLESLRPKDLRFRLERGTVTMTVSPLGRDGRLTVLAGDLSVQVVGTVFSVERKEACSRVSVRSGRVAITYRELSGTVSAGESREFCPEAKPAVATAQPPKPAALIDAVTASPSPSVQTVETPRKVAYPESKGPVTQPMSDEERLFRDATRSQGDAWGRARKLQDYLVHFPDGLFSEDALFHLVRLSYADGNSAEVVRLSEQFLGRRRQGRRAVEVQLLCAQSAMELGLPAHRSQSPLASVLAHLDVLPRGQREQATYLAIVQYCGTQRTELCSQWLRRYLSEFPNGTYTNQVRQYRGATGDDR